MEVKFNKNSTEWQMFVDFWTLCQKFWVPEPTDEYWEKCVESVGQFSKEYPDITLARGLALALINDLEERSKKR